MESARITNTQKSPDEEGSTKSKQKFIAVNILPPLDNESFEKAFARFKQQLEKAQELGFTHCWLNPICQLDNQEPFTRRDLDIGTHGVQYQSLYTIPDPTKIRAFFKNNSVKTLIKQFQDNNFPILVDFAWIYGGFDCFATSMTKSKNLNKEELEDLRVKRSSKLEEAFKVVDLYLESPPKGLGFSGLRIDAASHLDAEVRAPLYDYIIKKYPQAIIFEEVLFARNEVDNINQMTKSGVKSHFITGNGYYELVDPYGRLKHPGEMGDSEKMQLSNNHLISFTGNHDHYSVGWGTILYMAAQRASRDEGFLTRIASLSVFPQKDEVHTNPQIIKDLSKGETITVEGISGDSGSNHCLKYLLPFANEISKELLQQNPQTLMQFKEMFFKRIIDRTLPSPAGYFFLYSELESAFTTQRIFTNKRHEPLKMFLLTVKDLQDNQEALQTILKDMQKETIAAQPPVSPLPEPELISDRKVTSTKLKEPDPKKFARDYGCKVDAQSNLKPTGVTKAEKEKYEKAVKAYEMAKKEYQKALKGEEGGVSKKSAKGQMKQGLGSKKEITGKEVTESPLRYANLTNFLKNKDFKPDDENSLRLLLPYVIEYLRNNPEKATSFSSYKNEEAQNLLIQQEKQLLETLGLESFIKQISTIYLKLPMTPCVDYETFVSEDQQRKIIVRCIEKNTDIIIINIGPNNKHTIIDEELKKIAEWYKSRGHANSETRIIKPLEEFQTHLHLGMGLDLDPKIQNTSNFHVTRYDDILKQEAEILPLKDLDYIEKFTSDIETVSNTVSRHDPQASNPSSQSLINTVYDNNTEPENEEGRGRSNSFGHSSKG